MITASIDDLQANLSAYVKASEEELVVITRNGKPVAVLLAMDDDAELERLALAYSKRFQHIFEQARGQIQQGAGISHDAFWGTLDEQSDDTTA